MYKKPQRSEKGLFINGGNIPFDKKNQQIPILPYFFKVEVEGFLFRGNLVEPGVGLVGGQRFVFLGAKIGKLVNGCWLGLTEKEV